MFQSELNAIDLVFLVSFQGYLENSHDKINDSFGILAITQEDIMIRISIAC